MAIDLSGYVTVAQRITQFREAFPEGRLRPLNPEQPFQVVVIGEDRFIVYVAAAYRTPDDPCPGVGSAWETFPGKTPYTKDSELQNAETSAWGRAIVAALIVDTSDGIASADEVRNRREADGESGPGLVGPSEKQVNYIKQLVQQYDDYTPEMYDLGLAPLTDATTRSQASRLIEMFKALEKAPPAERRSTMRPEDDPGRPM